MTATTRSAAKDHPEGAAPASEASSGAKHKVEDGAKSPDAKRAKKEGGGKTQKTIEETIGGGGEKTEDETPADHKQQQEDSDATKNDQASNNNKDDTKKEKPSSTTKNQQPNDGDLNDEKSSTTTAVDPNGRKESLASSILEKGIIYFFHRGRINIPTPSSVNEIARTYFILRPLSKTASLSAGGPIGDEGNSRLCAIPKKVLPQSGKDRFISFVEKTHASFSELKSNFLAANDYDTKTAGTRHSPAATPVGEGVYAITSTGNDSHLAYILTLPEELGEVQKKMGLKERGSFVISTRNPQYPSPQNTRLPKGAEYPEEVREEFRSLRWAATTPKHLDYVNTQFLLVGDSSGLDKALEPQAQDKKEGNEEPVEELERLEEEDAERMKDLSKDDASRIFADLQADAGGLPKLQTTF